MTSDSAGVVSWAERAADRSPSVQRSRTRSIRQAQQIVDAARRLISQKGEQFTTQELAKEAGIALQTFYRYFTGKDQLLLAVFEDLLAESADEYEAEAKKLPDPLARLHFYIIKATSALSDEPTGSRFITAQHWHLQALFPEEMSRPTPFTVLVATELRTAQEQGLLHLFDVDQAAMFVSKLITAVYHHYLYAPGPADPAEVAEQIWTFCRFGLAGPPDDADSSG